MASPLRLLGRVIASLAFALGITQTVIGAAPPSTFRLVDYYYPPQEGATWLYQGPYWGPDSTHTRVRMASTNHSLTVYSPAPSTQEVLMLDSDYGYFSGGTFVSDDNWQDYPSVKNGFAFFGFDDDSDSGRLIMTPFPADIAVGQAITRKATMYDRTGKSLGTVSLTLQLLAQTAVTVPAGMFPDCLHLRMTLAAGGSPQVQELWWALGIGQVRSTRISGYDPDDNNGGYLEELVSTTATVNWAPASLSGSTMSFTIPGSGAGAMTFDSSTFSRTGFDAAQGTYTYSKLDGRHGQFSSLDLSPPANNGNQSTVDLTFTSSVGGDFVSHWHDISGDSGVTTGTFSLAVDVTKPTLTITTPTAGQRVLTNSGQWLVQGTASDSVGVAEVRVNLNNTGWQSANGTTAWQVPMALLPGSNTVSAYALDATGNQSDTKTVGFTYVVASPLVVQTVGVGTLTPNYNGQSLEAGKTYTMSAKAGKGFAFTGWTGGVTSPLAKLSFVMQPGLVLNANFKDVTNPRLVITAPGKKAVFTSATVQAKGTVTDNGLVAALMYQLNSGPWLNASGTTNWSASLTLTPGPNTLRAYAVDGAGNRSTTNTALCTYVVTAPLTLVINGSGTVTPTYSGQSLELGKSYKIAAKAASGATFTGWVGHVNGATVLTSQMAALTFTMQANLVLTANFSSGASTDEQAIRALYASIKTKLEGHDVNGFMALVAPDYLHVGQDRAAFQADAADVVATIKSFTFNITNIVIAGEFATVYGTGSIGFNNGRPTESILEPDVDQQTPGFGWLIKTPGGWRVYGNQMRAEVYVETAFSGTSHEFRLRAESVFAITNVVVTGPYIPATVLQPDAKWGGFKGWATPSVVAPVGTTYTFEVWFADGRKQTSFATVKSWVSVTPSPISVTPGAGTALISWPNVMASMSNGAGYWVWVYDGLGNWWESDDSDYLTKNSITVNQATLGFPLVSGTTYHVQVFIFNEYDDYGNAATDFVMP